MASKLHALPLALLLVAAAFTSVAEGHVHGRWQTHEGAGLPAPPCDVLHGMADNATASLMLRFWGGSYLGEDFPAKSPPTPVSYWVNAEAMEAVMDAVERTGGQRFLPSALSLMTSQRARSFRASFYDDASWMIAALARASAFTNDSLGDARSLFEGVRSGMDATCCGAHPGGVWWDVGHSQKATASNGGASVAASRLHSITPDPAYIDFSTRVFEFWWEEFVNLQTFAVTDHEDSSGNLVFYKFTYNQGLMGTAASLLAESTGNKTYIDRAQNLTNYMLTNMVDQGGVLSDGDEKACGGDCTLFKGPGFRGLALTQSINPTSLAQAVMNASIASLWTTARDTASGLFGVDWSSPPEASSIAYIGSSIAAVQALNIFASHMCPNSYPSPTLARFEAEEGLLSQTGLGDTYAGFSGWGYAVQTGTQGESVSVRFQVAQTCASATLVIGFSAGAGPASRNVALDQFPIQGKATFPATAGWDAYATIAVPLDKRTLLPSFSPAAAAHVVELYNDAGGNGQVHIDYVAIQCA